jgi:hypothetical protein
LLDEYGLDAKSLVAAVGALMGRDLRVTDADIAAARAQNTASDAKAEAL